MGKFDIPNDKLDQMMELASKKLEMDKETFQKKIQSGEMEGIVSEKSGMSPDKIRELLSSPEALKKLMSKPEVAELMKTFQQGK